MRQARRKGYVVWSRNRVASFAQQSKVFSRIQVWWMRAGDHIQEEQGFTETVVISLGCTVLVWYMIAVSMVVALPLVI